MNIISRSSKLALIQVQEVMLLLPKVDYKVIATESFGDKNKQISLLTNTQANIFTQELDAALIDGVADIAIHSAKDLPYPMPQGIEVICLTEAINKTDALVSKNNIQLQDLPQGSKIGTSSENRKRELMQYRPDLQIVSIRGTIEERLQLIDNNTIDALIVATCAMQRLGLQHKITQILPFATHHLQGHLAVVAVVRSVLLRSIFTPFDIRQKWGKAYICGFGAGNPNLLTLQAHKALQQCNVILHDDLIDQQYLTNYKAEKVYVGKRKNNHSRSQDEINEMLYQHVLQGKTVVRLKGGDPNIFGRGGEELDYLRQRLVNVEIIPGITAALAASAYAEIPLTYRNTAASVAFCTAFPPNNLPIPNTDTLVYYMGATELSEIAKKALAQGMNSNTPVAIVQNASKHNQKVWRRTLNQLAQNTETFESPLVTIIGNSILTRTGNNLHNNKIRIWATGTDANKFEHFANVLHLPLVAVKPVDINPNIESCIQNIINYQWLIFTSKYAVQYFFKFLFELHLDVRHLHSIKIASIGKNTSLYLKQNGIIPNVQATDESSEGILKLFNYKERANILIPRSDVALDILPKGLTQQGHIVNLLIVYQNYMPTILNKPNLTDFDVVAFASPSGVINFSNLYTQIPENLYFLPRGLVTKQAVIDILGNNNIIERL